MRPSMPPAKAKKATGRGKRPRDSSQEEKVVHDAFPPSHYRTSSNVSPTATSDGRSPGPALGAWSSGMNATPGVEAHYRQPINVITAYPPQGKVAIPALRPPQSFDSSARGSKKGRTSHACEACRKAKAGCTGETPCARCKNTSTRCVYGDGKREHDRKMMTKLKKETFTLTQHSTEVTDALRRIQQDTSLSLAELRTAIDEIMSMTLTPVSPDSRAGSMEPSQEPSQKASPGREEREQSNEGDYEDEVGSTGSLDVINVDTDRDDTRATGHMGKASAVSWAKRTNEEIRKQENPPEDTETGHTLSSYHVEDADVEHVEITDVNRYEWPDHGLADALLQIYFDHTHHAFPILNRAKFMARYVAFPRGANNLSDSDLIWLGTLNIIFAISAVFGELENRDTGGHVDDHMVYVARAKALCMDDAFLFRDPRLSTTTFLGLLSLYYITICKLNRAWTICGLAIRQGLTLGLHVRSEVKDMSDVETEHRVRLWWALYSLEVLLNESTGRPSCICDRDISTPLPVNIGEDEFVPGKTLYRTEDSVQSGQSGSPGGRSDREDRPSATYEKPPGYTQPLALSFPVAELPITSSTYIIYRTQLSIISHEIVTQLYCAATIKEKWSHVQETIKTIDDRLMSWRDSLPKEYDVTFDARSEPDWSDPNILSRIALAISFNSSRMILLRPFLCRVEGRMESQPEASKKFDEEAVETCIHSARRMISLLKWNSKSERGFYAISPWWNTLHYLCEALSVLMLEMAFQVEHLPSETADILNDAKAGVFSLAMLSRGSIAARKAWEIFDSLIRLVAPKINWSVFDLPTTVAIPAHYNWRRFNGKPDPDPWTQLSREKLEEHQDSQPTIPDSTTAWANQNSSQYTPESNASELFINQLQSSAAIERFTSMSHLYGSYDDPWPQLFAPTTLAPPLQIAASDPQMGSSLMSSSHPGGLPGKSPTSGFGGMTEAVGYTEMPLHRNVGAYDSRGHANVTEFRHGHLFGDDDMQREG